jgi:hypothetical protein
MLERYMVKDLRKILKFFGLTFLQNMKLQHLVESLSFFNHGKTVNSIWPVCMLPWNEIVCKYDNTVMADSDFLQCATKLQARY